MTRRVVIVATSELQPALLGELLSADDELHLVVPAIEQSRLQWLANDEDEARSAAEDVGRAIGRTAPTDPSTIDVKPDDPTRLVRDAIAEHEPDCVILALRDGDEASWLEEGALDAIPTRIDGVPITRIRIPHEP